MIDHDLEAGFRLQQWIVRPLLGRLSAGGVDHHVEPKVMDVLVQLARGRGDIVLREDIIERVWQGRPVSDDGISRCIRELRKVLGDDARAPRFIETVPKRGYRLLPAVEPLQETDLPPARRARGKYGHIVAAVIVAASALALILVIWLTADRTPVSPNLSTTRQTLAVLPLTNRSANPDDAFIVDGLHDDLLTQLARINAWDVISRTSVERFRDTEAPISEIAGRLHATLILEGGVQRSGQKVRINVQLIDAAGDSHVWAETYDRELTVENLFDVQSDIVHNIVRQLVVTLDVEPSPLPAPTRNFDAYSEYVKGRRLVRTESVTSLNRAIEHFRSAIEIDEQYAAAHAALADAELSLVTYFFRGGPQIDDAIREAEPHIHRALALDPELADAYVASAMLHMLQNDAEAAEEAIDRALRSRPSSPRAYRVLANLRWRQQRVDEAIELGEHASSLDPLSGVIQFELGRYYEAVGRYGDALSDYLIAADLLPNNALARLYIGALKYLVFGNVGESVTWYVKAAELDPDSPSMQATAAFAFIEIGDLGQAAEYVSKGRALDADAFWVRLASMFLHIRRGEEDAAVADAKAIRENVPKQWDALRILRDRDLADGNPQLALMRYSEEFPELTEPAEPRVDTENYPAAVDLALVYVELGDIRKVGQLTTAALEVMQSMSREGIFGYWLNDVAALSIRGDYDLALDRLESALDAGFRVRLWYHLNFDRNLESIRTRARFQQIRDKVDRWILAEAQNAQSYGEVSSN